MDLTVNQRMRVRAGHGYVVWRLRDEMDGRPLDSQRRVLSDGAVRALMFHAPRRLKRRLWERVIKPETPTRNRRVVLDWLARL